jgi:membrane carboxypeptidase/penicillin-binding protein
MSHIASGITGASPIWAQIINLKLKEKSISHRFPSPNNIVEVAICPLTGTLTCPECPTTRNEKFVKGTEPTSICTSQQIQTILNPTPSYQQTPPHQAQLLDGISHSRL